jgi:hypothetical protein
MLETIREYAGGCLQVSGEQDRIRRRHLDFFLALAEEAKTELELGFPSPTAEPRSSIAFERLELEHDNCRTGLDSARRLDERRLELRLVSALGPFWTIRGHLGEGRKRITDASSQGSGRPRKSAGSRAVVLRADGMLARRFQDRPRACGRGGCGLWATGDKSGVAKSLILLSVPSMGEGEFGRAKAFPGKEPIDLREVR